MTVNTTYCVQRSRRNTTGENPWHSECVKVIKYSRKKKVSVGDMMGKPDKV